MNERYERNEDNESRSCEQVRDFLSNETVKR